MGNIFGLVFHQEQQQHQQQDQQQEQEQGQKRKGIWPDEITIVTKFCDLTINLDKDGIFQQDNNIVFESDNGSITLPIKTYRYVLINLRKRI